MTMQELELDYRRTRTATPWMARSWEPHGVLLVLLEIVYSITDPPIKALGRIVKPIRIGNFALDLSFILVMILAYVALAVNRQIFLA